MPCLLGVQCIRKDITAAENCVREVERGGKRCINATFPDACVYPRADMAVLHRLRIDSAHPTSTTTTFQSPVHWAAAIPFEMTQI